MSRLDKITSKEKTGELYSDFYPNLNIHPGNDQLMKLRNEDAVKRSVRHITLTDAGERFYAADLGPSLRSLLFELPSDTITDLIREKISENLKKYEPRAHVLKILVIHNEYAQAYEVNIIFTTINSIDPITVNLTLYRVR